MLVLTDDNIDSVYGSRLPVLHIETCRFFMFGIHVHAEEQFMRQVVHKGAVKDAI